MIGLVGEAGLLPAGELLRRAGPALGARALVELPTVFWAASGDWALRLAIAAGLLAALALVLDLAPRIAALVLWLLYLSFATVAGDFLSFQWDNLLLESGFLAIFLAPGHLRPHRPWRHPPPEPHPLICVLFQWLLVRVLIESGLSKLLTGDPTWRDGTALASYYENAPLPTWVGWYAHQLPLAAHRAISFATLALELGLPLLVFGPRRARGVFFAVHTAFQIGIFLTANYGFFNPLSIALGLLALDDGHLRRLGRWVKWWAPAAEPVPAAEPAASRSTRRRRALLPAALLPAALTVLVVPISIGVFARIWTGGGLPRPLAALVEAAAPFRSVNAYHLFASMTLRRLEIEILGTRDGSTWEPYAFRWKPGDPRRRPRFVAPHQPRLDFQLWFLTLRGGPLPPYFVHLIERLCESPDRVAGFFAVDPFAASPPAAIRVDVYRYEMSTAAERRRDGVWWTRELVGTMGTVSCAAATGAAPTPPGRSGPRG